MWFLLDRRIIRRSKRNHIHIPKTICTHSNFQFGCLSWYSPSRDSYRRRLTPEPVFLTLFLILGIFTTEGVKKISNNNTNNNN